MKNVTINRCNLVSKNIYRKCWSKTRVQIFKQGKMAIKKRRRVVQLQKEALSNNLSFLHVLIQKIKALKSWINHRKQSNPRSWDISLKGRGKHSPVPEQHAHTHTPDTIRAFQSPSLSRRCLWSRTERWSLKVTGVEQHSEANNLAVVSRILGMSLRGAFKRDVQALRAHSD